MKEISLHQQLEIDFALEDDGRVIAEIAAIPGCLAYGRTREEAAEKVRALAREVMEASPCLSRQAGYNER